MYDFEHNSLPNEWTGIVPKLKKNSLILFYLLAFDSFCHIGITCQKQFCIILKQRSFKKKAFLKDIY